MNYGMFCKKHNHQYDHFCPYCAIEFKQPINMKFDTIEYIEKRVAAGNDLSPKHGEILLEEIEALKVQARNFCDMARENRELADLIAKAENQRDAAIKDHIRCCETNNHNARMYGECKQLLQKHGIHMVSKECWCNPTAEKDCFQPPEERSKQGGWALWELRKLIDDLNDADLRALYATIGGKLGKRQISAEQQAKMQQARKRKVI